MNKFSKKVFYSLSLIFIISSISTFSQTKKYPTLLWKISGNGLSKPSYLYGTMHVSKKVAFHLTDAFFEGLKSVDAIALETNPETWLEEMMEEGSSLLKSNYYKKYLYGGYSNENFYENAFDFYTPNNKFIQVQLARDPDDVNSLLYRYNGYSSGNFEEYTYLDLFIMQTGRKSGKPIIALEDFKTSMEMVTKSSMPDDDDDKKPKASNKKYISPYAVQELIEDAYRKGDLDLLDSLHKQTYRTKNHEKYMIVDRNIIMANNIDSILKIKALFSAVGAAHLPGNMGVIELLRKKGYTVEPVFSDVTKKSVKTMHNFEDMHTSLNFTTQYASDSSFKVDAPGKLFELKDYGKYTEYLYTDMVNGSFYMIKRINTYGNLFNQDAAYQIRRIDSLLYENIPGKIISKKTIKANNGISGFDIVNKTRRGDYQHYNIYADNQFIYIFKVGATSDYAKSPEIDRFFKSIQFIDSKKNEGLTTYSPSYGGYEIKLPANFLVEKPKDSDYQREKITANDDKNYYLFFRSLLNDYDYIEEDTFELNQLAKSFYEALDYKLVSKTNSIYEKYPCVKVISKKKDADNYIHVMIVLKDAQYFLMACKNNEKISPDNYFNSLKWKEYKYEKFEKYVDTVLHFNVMTDYKEEKKSAIEALIYKYDYKRSKKKNPDYLSKSLDKEIESPVTGEKVKVDYFKVNDYRTRRNIEDVWKVQDDYYKKNTSLYFKDKKKYEKNGIPYYEITLSDTNTIKIIKVKMFLKQGVIYYLTALTDTVSPPSKWLTSFFDTFTPNDTLIGKPIFTDKTDEFFGDLVSKDSVTKEKVKELYSEISFDDKHADKIMKFIDSKHFDTINLNIKCWLIKELGVLKSSKISPFLEKQYNKYIDSASIQLAVLSALGWQKNVQANTLFTKLLNAETPLSYDQ